MILCFFIYLTKSASTNFFPFVILIIIIISIIIIIIVVVVVNVKVGSSL